MKKTAFLLALALLFSLAACSQSSSRSSTFYLMDTVITVTLYTTDDDLAEETFAQSRGLLNELDSLWARQKEGSEVARFNASYTAVSELDARTVSLLQTALALSEKTGGAFDITVAPLVDVWQICGEEDRLPTAEELQATVGYGYLTLTDTTLAKSDPSIGIDLGGIGKGAAISLLIDYLGSTDVSGGLVSFGSNVAVFGEKPNGADFRVALRDPKDENGTVGTLTMRAGDILSVSGDYERYVTVNGQKYHHILDPKTGYPADTGLASVAVIAHDGALADALSTALFVMGLEDALTFYRSGVYDFEAVFVASDGTVTVTDGLGDAFFA